MVGSRQNFSYLALAAIAWHLAAFISYSQLPLTPTLANRVVIALIYVWITLVSFGTLRASTGSLTTNNPTQ